MDIGVILVGHYEYHFICVYHFGRVRLSIDGRALDEPPAETQPDGGRVQQREREFHAGDPPAGSEYSVNLPTRFYYKKRWHNGWNNVVNPFHATIVLGTPGSGMSFAVVNNFIKQQIEKEFSAYIYGAPVKAIS